MMQKQQGEFVNAREVTYKEIVKWCASVPFEDGCKKKSSNWLRVSLNGKNFYKNQNLCRVTAPEEEKI